MLQLRTLFQYQTTLGALGGMKVGCIVLALMLFLPMQSYAQEQGHATPQVCHESLKMAIDKNDWKSAFNHMTPRTRDILVGITVMVFRNGAYKQDGSDLLSRFSDTKKLDLLVEQEDSFRDRPTEFMSRVAGTIRKMPEFMTAAIETARKVDSKFGLFYFSKDIRLVNVKIENDRATADFMNERGAEEPTEFVKKNGSWLWDHHKP